jgi:hypothetical protein
MPQRIAFILWIALLSARPATGQSFPVQDAAWQGVRSNIAGLDTFRQVACGDTLIAGRHYTPMLSISPDSGDTTYLAAVRSTGVRSFFVRPGETQEYLLYDFSLQVGDEIMLEFVEFSGSTMLKVASVVTVGSGADARTVINFVPTNGLQETWISGVGSLAGPLYRGLLNPSEYSELQCFRLTDTLAYNTVDEAQCTFSFNCPVIVSTTATGPPVQAQVFPTLPSDGRVWVANNSNQVLSATLFSAIGQPLQSWAGLGPGRHELQLPGLSSGLYVLQLQEPNKNIYLQHFKLIIPR